MPKKTTLVEALPILAGTRAETPAQRQIREYLAQAAKVAKATIKAPRTTSIVTPKDPLATFGKFNRPGDRKYAGQSTREQARRLRQRAHSLANAVTTASDDERAVLARLAESER